MNAPLVEKLNLTLSGVSPRIRMVSLIVLAMEIDHLQAELGYVGGGQWNACRGECLAGRRLRWPDYVLQNAGITVSTAINYSKCVRVVLARLRALSFSGKDDMLALMEAKPSDLTPEQRQSMMDAIGRLALKAGDTMATLRREFRTPPLPPNRQTPDFPSCAGSKFAAARAWMAEIEGDPEAAALAAWLESTWEQDLAEKTEEIAALARLAGIPDDEAQNVAAMVLLDQGRGFPGFEG